MYEALLKATPEYQKIAASFAQPGPAALFGLPPAGRALLYAALQKDLGRVLCIVTPGEAEATHFADDPIHSRPTWVMTSVLWHSTGTPTLQVMTD